MKYKEILVKRIEHSEIDLDMPYYIGDESNDIDFDRNIESETESIDINLVINTLTQLKEQGSSHVYIVPHCDHHAYIFTGVKYKEQEESEEQKIVGYVCPTILFGGEVPKGSVWYKHDDNQYKWKLISNGGYYLPKEIVENWEPYYNIDTYENR